MVFARKSDIEDAKNHKLEKQGMEYNRSCTDIVFCIFFIVFVVGMIGVSGFALATGEPSKIMTPYDSDGNACGMPGQIASIGKYLSASEENTMTADEKTAMTTAFSKDVLEARDFTDYPVRVYTNL